MYSIWFPVLIVVFCSFASAAPPLLRKSREGDLKSNDLNESDPKVVGNRKMKPQVDTPNVLFKKRPDIVRRPDHLEAVPLERDGELNKKFRQEILFGDQKPKMPGSVDHKKEKHGKQTADEEAEEKSEEKNLREPEKLLKEVFDRADTNKDYKLSSGELEAYIQENTVKHLDDAVDESKRVFDVIDSNRDGFATWEEYHFHFLTDNDLMDPEKAKKHDESHADLNPDDQEKIETEIQEWHEADDNPKDGRLSPDEFLAFRHPEHSRLMLDNMVQEIMRNLGSIQRCN